MSGRWIELKKIALIIAALLAFYFLPARAIAAGVDDIISETAVLMDAETGQILFDKGGDKRMYPASTTKIMTALIAAQKCGMDEIAEVTKSAVDIDEWNSANIALIPGEKLPLDSLMYGLMLPSANDAANVIAEYVAGSQSEFARLMTERARAVGAVNTHFANAHGLHDPDHYTTARDMALITREAIKNPVFRQYFGASVHTIPATNLQPLERPFTNYQYMLNPSTRYYNPIVTGGKVGYTLEARHTMSTAATRDGRTLICVVMNSPNRNDKFVDTAKLLDFGFDEFSPVTVSKEKFPGFTAEILRDGVKAGEVEFKNTGDFHALLHNSIDFSTLEIKYSNKGPFEDGKNIESYTEFTVKSDNPAIPSLIGRSRLEQRTSMPVEIDSATLNLRGDFASTLSSRPWFVPVIIASVMLFIFGLLFTVRQINLRRMRKRRRERLARLQREREGLYQYRGNVRR